MYVLTSLGEIRSYDPDATVTFGIPHAPSCQIGSPFSMTIDRLGRAWTVMTNGNDAQLKLVDPDHGYCEPLAFDPNVAGFERFSLTFVAEGQVDRLAMVGGSEAAFAAQETRLAIVDPTTFEIVDIGSLPGAPEITGTSEGRLFGYFPFATPAKVAEIDPRDATLLASWDMPPLSGTVVAWAAAYWNGKIVVFDSRATSSLGPRRNRIFSVDPKTGTITTIDDDSPHVVSGAGVSTCSQEG